MSASHHLLRRPGEIIDIGADDASTQMNANRDATLQHAEVSETVNARTNVRARNQGSMSTIARRFRDGYEDDMGYRFDLFMSHAKEDKDHVVRPLRNRLAAAGLEIWFDEDQINVGDSLMGAVGQGLRDCRFAVVIISDKFLSKPGRWAEGELETLYALERKRGEGNIILPVLHNTTEPEVLSRFPLLASRSLILPNHELDFVADKILSKVKGPPPPAPLIDAAPTPESTPSRSLAPSWLKALLIAPLGLVAVLAFQLSDANRTAQDYLQAADALRDANQHGSALRLYMKAERRLRDELAAAPADERVQREHYSVLGKLGREQQILGDPEATLRTFKQRLEAVQDLQGRNPGSRSWLFDCWQAQNDYAHALQSMGRLNQAIAYYEQNLQHARASSAAAPATRAHGLAGGEEWQYAMATNLNDLGEAYQGRGNFTAALTSLDRASKLIGDSQSASLRMRSALWRTHFLRGGVLEYTGDLSGALGAYLESRRLASELLKDNQTDRTRRLYVSLTANNIGAVLKTQGKLPDALHEFREAERIMAGLKQADSDNVRWGLELAASRTWIGRVQHQQGQLDAALQSLRAAADLLEAMPQQDVAVKRGLVITLKFLARTYLAKGQPRQATDPLVRALLLLDRGEGPSEVASERQEWVELQQYRVQANLMLGASGAARQACQHGYAAEQRERIEADNRVFWGLTFGRLDLACAAVEEREARLGAWQTLANQALARARHAADLSPGNHDVQELLQQARAVVQKALPARE